MTKLAISNTSALIAAALLTLIAGLLVQSVIIDDKSDQIAILSEERSELLTQLRAQVERELQDETRGESPEGSQATQSAKVLPACRAESFNDDYALESVPDRSSKEEPANIQSSRQQGKTLVMLDVGYGPTGVNVEQINGALTVKPRSGLVGGLSLCYFFSNDFCLGAGVQSNSSFNLKLGAEF